MNLLSIIGAAASHFPKTILQLRSLKAVHRLVSFSRPIDEVPFMWEYVCRAEIANRNNPDWAMKADKYAVRRFVADRIGDEYLIPIYGVWRNPEDIDFDSLPDKFILKTNNGCATNVFVHDKSTLNRTEAIARLRKSLDFPYPELSAQPHYSMIAPCIIAEKFMEQGDGSGSLTDYKIHCVNGEPVRIYVYKDRDEVRHFNYKLMAFDSDWNECPEAVIERFRVEHGRITRPENLSKMLDAARRLSDGEEYARVDFYIIDGRLYFGEITLTPDTAGNQAFPLTGMNVILDRIKADRRSGKSTKTF